MTPLPFHRRRPQTHLSQLTNEFGVFFEKLWDIYAPNPDHFPFFFVFCFLLCIKRTAAARLLARAYITMTGHKLRIGGNFRVTFGNLPLFLPPPPPAGIIPLWLPLFFGFLSPGGTWLMIHFWRNSMCKHKKLYFTNELGWSQNEKFIPHPALYFPAQSTICMNKLISICFPRSERMGFREGIIIIIPLLWPSACFASKTTRIYVTQ